MTTRPPVGVGERDEEYLAWQVEDFVKRMLENEQRKAGSIETWLGSVWTHPGEMTAFFKEQLRDNVVTAQQELDRRVQVLGTDEEAQFVFWQVHGRLLKYIETRNVAAPVEPDGTGDEVAGLAAVPA